MATLADIRDRLIQIWRGMDQPRKVKLTLGAAAVLTALIVLVVFMRPGQEVLFANLAPEEAGEITTRLDEMGVSYELVDEGTTVLVPEDQVYQLRNELVSEGHPRGGVVDFGLFDEIQLGMTEFERRVQFRRALQGELTQTISNLNGVRDAWVQLNIPEPRLYTEEEEIGSASVLIDPVTELEEGQVRGIVHLVAQSAESIDPELVTVVDTQGRVLTDDMALEETHLGQTAGQLEIQREVERDLERGIRSMLERVLGLDRVVARVRADLDFDQREVHSTFFDPEDQDGVLRSMHELERTFEGEGMMGAVPGTPPNVPGQDIPVLQEGAGGTADYYEYEATRNYEIDEIQEHHVIAPGQVERLSVAVLIDDTEGEGLTMEQRLAVEDAVGTAVGLDLERGDEITVSSVPFAVAPFEELLEELEPRAPLLPLWALVLLVAGAAVAGVLVLQQIRKRRQLAAEEEDKEEEEVPPEPLSPEEARKRQLAQQVESLVREQPDAVAQVLSSWMAED